MGDDKVDAGFGGVSGNGPHDLSYSLSNAGDKSFISLAETEAEEEKMDDAQLFL